MQDALVKRICAIMPMLGSDNDGEVINAARAIKRILKDNNGHWTDLASRLAQPAQSKENPYFRHRPEPPPRAEKAQPTDQPRRKKSAWLEDKEDVENVFIRRGELDEWSHEFLESIHDQVVHMGRSLTEKQRSKLNEILDKLGVS